MNLVQVSKREGRIDRVPKHQGSPVVELGLNDNQSVIEVNLEPIVRFDSAGIDRKTQDWRWVAYVATRC